MSSKHLVVASGNLHKIQEFGEILIPMGWSVVSIRELLPSYDEPEETEQDFAGNSALKCRHAASLLRKADLGTALPSAVVADDSGLWVALLGGDPGVHSARFAQLAGRGQGDSDNRKELIRRLILEGLTPGDTTPAAFVCALHLKNLHSGSEIAVEAACEGQVGIEEHGAKGFGYDSLFYPLLGDGNMCSTTFGELTADDKHGMSHRGRALRKLATRLLTF